VENKPVWFCKQLRSQPPKAGGRTVPVVRPDQANVVRHRSFSGGLYYRPNIVAAYYLECGLPEPDFEIHDYIPNRKFVLDIGWPLLKIGIEVQGATWRKGGHSSGAGINRDMEKRNLAIINGWRIIEITPQQVCMLDTVTMIKALIRMVHC